MVFRFVACFCILVWWFVFTCLNFWFDVWFGICFACWFLWVTLFAVLLWSFCILMLCSFVCLIRCYTVGMFCFMFDFCFACLDLCFEFAWLYRFCLCVLGLIMLVVVLLFHATLFLVAFMISLLDFGLLVEAYCVDLIACCLLLVVGMLSA